MGIMWNQLSPIQPPQVIGQLPVVNQPNQADQLASGIMSGLSQADQMKTNALSRAATQQQMDQSKQLFPSQLQNSQAVAQQNQTKAINDAGQQQFQSLDEAKQYAREKQVAAKQGEQKYIEVLNPVEKVQYLTNKATLQQTIAQAHSLESGASKTDIENYHTTVQSFAQMNSSASQGRTPEEQERIFQMQFKMLPEGIRKTLASEGFDHYNPQNAAAAMQIGTEEMNNYILTHAKEVTPSDSMKNASRIAKLKNIQNPTQEQQDELQALQEQTKSKSMTAAPADAVRTETTSKYLQTRDTTKSVAVSNLASLDMMGKLSDSGLAGAGADLKLSIGKIISAVTGSAPDPKIPLTESLNAFAKTYQVSQQVLMKGSSSDRDMSMLAETGPQINNTAQGRKLMANQLAYKENMTINQVNFEHAWSDSHNADMTGADEAWSKFVQSRSDFNPKTMMFDTRPTNKDWKPFLDENHEAPKQQQEFQSGQIYQDANGNKARYNNGQWEPVQ